MSEPWHDINDPGFFTKPVQDDGKEEPAAADEPAEEKPGPIVTLSDAKFVPPDSGIGFNDKCAVQVSVAYSEQTSQTRVTFKLFCIYQGADQDLKHKADANEDGGVAKAQLQLFYPDDYKDGSADYYFTAEHSRADKDAKSETLSLPYAAAASIVVRIEADASDENLQNDSFRLFSTDSDATYSRTMAMTDGTQGDQCVEFEFDDVQADLKYSLEVDCGGTGNTCLVFEDISCSEPSA